MLSSWGLSPVPIGPGKIVAEIDESFRQTGLASPWVPAINAGMTLRMTVFTEFAPAKVNLTLEVLGKRPDGYHELASLVAFARDAADVVTLDIAKPVGSDVSGPFGKTISGQNLIDLTLAKLKAAAPELKLGHVHLVKNLPVAAGIGGGSADAAAVLRAVKRANPDRAETVDWHAIARALGADVPVCFENRASWMTGTGIITTPLANVPKLAAVLVNPLQPMPHDKTAQVFRALNAPPMRFEFASPPLPPGPFATALEVFDYMAANGNALDAAACKIAPVIAEVKTALLKIDGCRYAAVSGGGPTCFGVFADNEKAAAEIARQHPSWWVRAVMLG
jgi:4-diphosphocytidyl-2-C-methyl-D-erythritol kinase